MYNLSTSKAIYAVLGPKFLRFQIFFSGLRTQPTNRPSVRDYDPDTPLDTILQMSHGDVGHNTRHVMSFVTVRGIGLCWQYLFHRKPNLPPSVDELLAEPFSVCKRNPLRYHLSLSP